GAATLDRAVQRHGGEILGVDEVAGWVYRIWAPAKRTSRKVRSGRWGGESQAVKYTARVSRRSSSRVERPGEVPAEHTGGRNGCSGLALFCPFRGARGRGHADDARPIPTRRAAARGTRAAPRDPAAAWRQ